LVVYSFFYLSGGKAYCYSILQGDNKILSENAEKIGENIQIEKGVKRKKPYVTLLTNVLLPMGIFSATAGVAKLYDPEDSWGVILLPTVMFLGVPLFTFTTIPAHIYVGNSFIKTFLFISGKIIGGGIIWWRILEDMGCALAERTSCSSPLPGFIVGWTIIGGIYIYEVIDTYRAAVKYNEKLEKEKQNSQFSFFIQPIITPKGDIFLTGGIRF
jgi:hypothetical protein